jgi:hypothetical protein
MEQLLAFGCLHGVKQLAGAAIQIVAMEQRADTGAVVATWVPTARAHGKEAHHAASCMRGGSIILLAEETDGELGKEAAKRRQQRRRTATAAANGDSGGGKQG